MKSEKRQTEEKKKKTDLTKTKEEINKFEKPEIIVPTISFLHIFFFLLIENDTKISYTHKYFPSRLVRVSAPSIIAFYFCLMLIFFLS